MNHELDFNLKNMKINQSRNKYKSKSREYNLSGVNKVIFLMIFNLDKNNLTYVVFLIYFSSLCPFPEHTPCFFSSRELQRFFPFTDMVLRILDMRHHTSDPTDCTHGMLPVTPGFSVSSEIT